jgi:hypothetical protein
MNRYQILATIVFSLFSIILSGQRSNLREGAYLKNDGTRVEGYFKQNISLRQETSVWFLPALRADPVRLGLDSLREIIIGEQERYIVYEIPRKENDEISLMKQVTRGAVNLFRGISTDRGIIYLWRDRGDEVLVSRSNFEGFLQSVAQRCPGIQAAGYRFNQGDLIDLGRAYRDCRYPGTEISVLEEPAGFRFSIGIRPYWYTTNFHQAEDAYYGRGEYDRESSFSAALALAWMAGPRLRLMLEPGYTRVLSSSDYVNVPPYSEADTYSRVTFDLQYIDVPLLVHYTFPLTTFRPFVEGGLYLGIPIQREVTDELVPADPSHIRYKPGPVRFEESNFGYTVGAGVGLPLSSGFEAEIIARWTQSASSMEVDSDFNEGPAFHNFRNDLLQVGLRLWWVKDKYFD